MLSPFFVRDLTAVEHTNFNAPINNKRAVVKSDDCRQGYKQWKQQLTT